MDCRKCGACCIAPSISTPIPGMPGGKPAGTRCVHLTGSMLCGIYDDRPPVCRNYTPTPEICGSSFEESMVNHSRLEELTR